MSIRRLLFSILALSSPALSAAPQPETLTNDLDIDAGNLLISIQGKNFGAGPDVLFFHDFEGVEDGTLVGETTPIVGEMAVSHGDPTVGSHLGVKGFWVVNESRGRPTFITTKLGEYYSDVFIAYSVVVPEGRTSPSQTEQETWGGSTWKFSWLLEGDGANNDGNRFDLVLPQQNGNSGTLHGNASQFRKVGSGSADSIADMSDWWHWGESNYMSGWVRSAADNPSRSSGNFSAANSKFGFQSFSTTSDHELVGPAPSVSHINFPGWVRDTEDDNFQALYGNFYIAGGSNMLARVEITDNENYISSSYRKVLLPSAWTDELIEVSVGLGVLKNHRPLYVHVFNASGERSSVGLFACQKCPVMN